ncbi:MAG: sulfite exporter TauE/SafE family protein [Candidatus Nanopelagicales bacterium]
MPAAGARDVGVGAGAGIVSGLFGVGGGIVLVPYLVLVRGWQQKQAQATSLVMVAMAATAGLVQYALADQVVWAAGAAVLVGGLVGALVGSSLVARLQSWILQVAFAGLLIIAALRMVTTSVSDAPGTPPDLDAVVIGAYIGSGLAMGILSALFGIGGGILLVPLLVTVFGYDVRLAAGTSLAVMGLIALVGALRQSRQGATHWGAGVLLGLGGIAGGLVGAALAQRVPLVVLTWLFAALLAYTAVRLAMTGWRGRHAGQG